MQIIGGSLETKEPEEKLRELEVYFNRKRDRMFRISAIISASVLILVYGILRPLVAEDLVKKAFSSENWTIGLGLVGLLIGMFLFLEPPVPAVMPKPQEDEKKSTEGKEEASADFKHMVNDAASYVSARLTPEDLRTSEIERAFRRTTHRLEMEIVALGKRAVMNLILGTAVTFIGLAFLMWAVVQLPPTSDYSTHAIHFLPRFALVIVIEIFAYFFLKLYRENLHGMRYFQNELTNVESKQIALIAARERIELDIRKDVIEALVKTERNFIIEKGQSTVELERVRFEKDTTELILNQLGRIFRAQRGK